MKDYKVKNWPIKSKKGYFPKFGEVNLNTLTDKSAESLVSRGFPYLEKKKSSKKSEGKDEQ